MYRAPLILFAAIICGCTSAQLSRGTVNVASTIEEIETSQAIANFSRIADNAFALPSLVSIVGGTVQVVNTVTPSVSFPLTSMFARVSSGSPSTTTTTAGAGATFSGTISWQQNFNIVPMTDQFTLRNIAALYRAVVYCDPSEPAAWLGPYHLSAAAAAAASDPKWPSPRHLVMPADYVGYQVPRFYGRSDQLIPDPYSLEKPNCVLCIKEGLKAPQTNEELRERTTVNTRVFGECWLYHSTVGSPEAPPLGATILGSSGNNVFYLRRGYDDALAEFLILTLPTSAGPTRFASVTKGETNEKSQGAKGEPSRGAAPEVPQPAQEFFPAGQPEGANTQSILVFPGIQTPPQ